MQTEAKKIAPKPVEILTGRFQHFASEAEKQQHLKEVAEAQRNGSLF